MKTIEQLASEIIAFEGKAETNMWEAASHYYQAVDVQKCAPGEFAKLVGKSKSHVTRMRKLGNPAFVHNKTRTFWEHYGILAQSTTSGSIRNLSDLDSTTTEEAAVIVTKLVESHPEGLASVLREAITNVQMASLQASYEDAVIRELTEVTPVRAAQRSIGHAKVPREKFEGGAVAAFQIIANRATLLAIMLENEGIRQSDLDYAAQSVASMIEDTHRVEKVAQQMREVLYLINAESEMNR